MQTCRSFNLVAIRRVAWSFLILTYVVNSHDILICFPLAGFYSIASILNSLYFFNIFGQYFQDPWQVSKFKRNEMTNKSQAHGYSRVDYVASLNVLAWTLWDVLLFIVMISININRTDKWFLNSRQESASNLSRCIYQHRVIIFQQYFNIFQDLGKFQNSYRVVK